MRAIEHGQVLAEVGGISATVLRQADGVRQAVALLDQAEAAANAPLVDESERARLMALVDDPGDRDDHWHFLLARTGDGHAVGYLGLDLSGPTIVGDVALDRDLASCSDAMRALLHATTELGSSHGGATIQVWVRHSRADDIACAADVGFSVGRRLAVLGRDLPLRGHRSEASSGDWTIRSYRGSDDDGLLEVLVAAYAGTDDGGWTPKRLRARLSYDWFQPDDLLVAERAGRIVGLHWTKRRNDAVGEVYNLAVHPDVQGTGLGVVLLTAGLDHLTSVGCERAILWVDQVNERAMRMYSGLGFSLIWEDVALRRELRTD